MSALTDITTGLSDIWASDYVQKNPNKAYKAQYASEYTKVAAYLNGGVEPNFSGFSRLGKGLCEAERARRALVVSPPTPGYAVSAPTATVTT